MIQGELTPEKYRFPEVFDSSEKNQLPKEKPAEGSLATQFPAHFEIEPFPSKIGEKDPRPTPGDYRRHALDACLLKLSTIEIDGKEHVEEYLRYQYRRYFKGSTIRNSYVSLECFLKLIKGKGDIKKIEKTDLEKFVEHEQDRGMKLSTVRLRLAVVKAFMRFMIERGVVKEEVFPWKLNIKMPDILPRAMDPEDVERLLKTNVGVRDRAMVLLLLRTGLRIGELLSTRVMDVIMAERKILIFEADKNLKGRVVYFSNDAKEALEAWLKKRNKTVELLFYGQKGRALSYPAARMVFMKYLDKAGLSQKGYTLHCLRHTFATDLLNAGIPMECLEKLMGHSRLEVTRRYAMLSDKTREKEYFKAMAIIERRESDVHNRCDRELQALLEKAQLFPSHCEELHELA
ncbi:MAG: tyrosine-type recombinase/integrase [Deltaproteobacteria bacterium]|nr:tyrosine-type recombinase/integrase [Deltaproteobacteria bacterium]